jgi:putative lipase involved disintegration of autophagic bodies
MPLQQISVISWPSDLLVEETLYPEKTIGLPQVTDKLMLYRVHITMSVIRYHSFSGDWVCLYR